MHKSRRVLLAQDNPADTWLFRESVKNLGIDIQVDVVEDGERAIALAKQGDPDLIVLNLNLPRLNGIEVLRELRTHHGSQLIPVIIYTGTGLAAEVTAAYRAGANCVVQKPMMFETYMAAVQDICKFWLQRAILPEHVGATVSIAMPH